MTECSRLPLQGRRVMPHPALTWLVVMEAHWQRTLDDKEFAFGHMLHELFARVPWAQVRHRFYSDEASLVRWCRQLMYLPEPAVLVITGHGETSGLTVEGRPIGMPAIVDSLRLADSLKLLHLSACLVGQDAGQALKAAPFHQLLQWHHMPSSWFPVNTIANLELNTLWDGIFHSATYLFVVAGLFALWRSAQRRHLFWSTKLLAGTMLLGFGLFNTAEGLINHHVLGIHHVNETAARESWVYWDIAFTLSGLLMLAAGWLLVRQGEHETAVAASDKRGRNGPGK